MASAVIPCLLYSDARIANAPSAMLEFRESMQKIAASPYFSRSFLATTIPVFTEPESFREQPM